MKRECQSGLRQPNEDEISHKVGRTDCGNDFSNTLEYNPDQLLVQHQRPVPRIEDHTAYPFCLSRLAKQLSYIRQEG